MLPQAHIISLNQNAISLTESAISYPPNSKDEFGFYTGCSLPKTESRLLHRLKAPEVTAPSIRLIESKNKLDYYEGFYNRKYVTANNADLKYKDNITLYSFTYKLDNNIKNYKKTAVNWPDKIKKTPYDLDIKSKEMEIINFKKHIEEFDNIGLLALRSNVKLCMDDRVRIIQLKREINMFSHVKDGLLSCGTNSIDELEVIETLYSLNKIGIKNLNLPNTEKLINKKIKQSLFGKHVKTVDTSIKGGFKLDNISSGNYLLIAEYKDSFTTGFWSEIITISSGEELRIDLNNNNFNLSNLNDELDKLSKQ